MKGSALTFSILAFSLVGALRAQVYGDGRDGAFAPAADVTLDTSAGGVWQFTSIAVPVGVTVRVVGPHAARFLCQGAVAIDGAIDASAPGSRWVGAQRIGSTTAGPGGYAGGVQFQNGDGPGGGAAGLGFWPVVWGSCASHATAGTPNPLTVTAPRYGGAFPFDLTGGSGGGGCGPIAGTNGVGPPASGGGGAVAILADGPITVTGAIRARGGDIAFGPEFALSLPPGTGGNGSGGALLLRSLQCVRVSGTLDLGGGATTIDGAAAVRQGGDGWLRIDAYSACGAPALGGATIRAERVVTSLPHLAALEPARVGATYRMRCASAPGDVLGVYYSPGTATLPVPPFGTLELDPILILFLGRTAVPQTGDDPLAAIDVPIPPVPSLAGITFHAQAFNAFGFVTGAARLSNHLVVTIGP